MGKRRHDSLAVDENEYTDPHPSSEASKRPEPIRGDQEVFEDLVGGSYNAEPQGLESRWLYQSEDAVFGPVSARELLELLYAGTISGETLISPEEGDFRSLSRFGAFRAHIEPAQTAIQKRKAVQERARIERRVQHLRRWKWVGRAAIGIFVGALMTYGWVRWRQIVSAEAEKARQQTAIKAELARLLEEVQIEPPLAPLILEPTHSKGAFVKRRGGSRRKGSMGRRPLTDREVMRGMGRAFPGLVRCIKAQLRRDSASIPATIILQFSIENKGRVRDVSLADRFLRRSPMLECVRTRLDVVRWRSFEGEVRNVEYPITVRRPQR